MGFEGLLDWGFWLWSPDVIWKFVPDHRTGIWKGSLTKGFCFNGGNTKNVNVTGRTELSRWCISPQDPGQIFRTEIWQRTVTEGGYFVLNSTEENSPTVPSAVRTRNLSITSPALYQLRSPDPLTHVYLVTRNIISKSIFWLWCDNVCVSPWHDLHGWRGVKLPGWISQPWWYAGLLEITSQLMDKLVS